MSQSIRLTQSILLTQSTTRMMMILRRNAQFRAFDPSDQERAPLLPPQKPSSPPAHRHRSRRSAKPKVSTHPDPEPFSIAPSTNGKVFDSFRSNHKIQENMSSFKDLVSFSHRCSRGPRDLLDISIIPDDAMTCPDDDRSNLLNSDMNTIRCIRSGC